MKSEPAIEDLLQLQAHFDSAMVARHDIVWKGNYPEYPESIAGLMNYIGSSPWCNDHYDPGETGAILIVWIPPT